MTTLQEEALREKEHSLAESNERALTHRQALGQAEEKIREFEDATTALRQ